MPAPVRFVVAAIAAVLALAAAPASAHVAPEPAGTLIAHSRPADVAAAPMESGAATAGDLAAPSPADIVTGPAASAPWGGIAALALGAAVLGLALRRRRVATILIAAVVAVAAVEMAVHATHHAGDPAAEARCIAAQTASHLSADDAGPAVVPAPVVLVQPLTPDSAATVTPPAPASPPGSRAPPVPLA